MIIWLSRELLCLVTQAVSPADSNRNRWGLPDGSAKPDHSHNAADTYPVEIGGKSLFSFILQVEEENTHLSGFDGALWPPDLKWWFLFVSYPLNEKMADLITKCDQTDVISWNELITFTTLPPLFLSFVFLLFECAILSPLFLLYKML